MGLQVLGGLSSAEAPWRSKGGGGGGRAGQLPQMALFWGVAHLEFCEKCATTNPI